MYIYKYRALSLPPKFTEIHRAPVPILCVFCFDCSFDVWVVAGVEGLLDMLADVSACCLGSTRHLYSNCLMNMCFISKQVFLFTQPATSFGPSYGCVHVCVSMYIYVGIYTRLCVIYMDVYIYMLMYVHTCMLICIYIYEMHLCMCMLCMHVCLYIRRYLHVLVHLSMYP